MDAKKIKGRRTFLQQTATIAAGTTLIGAPAILRSYGRVLPADAGVRLGVITYSYRSMPDQSAEAILGYVQQSGISHIELMGDVAESFAGKPDNPVDMRNFYRFRRAKRDGQQLSVDEEKEMADMEKQSKAYQMAVARWREKTGMGKFRELSRMYKDGGVNIYAYKPRAFGTDNSKAEMDFGMKAAKTLGATHVTLEHPSDDTHTQLLGELAARHKVYVAYHGHEQQHPTFWDTALEQSPYNALNLDLGHYVAAGNENPLDIIKAKHQRIMSMHLKDRQRPENGKGNVVWGAGDTPIAGALQLVRDKQYNFPLTIELEYDIPPGSDAVQEVRKCHEYCLEALQK